MAIFAAMSVQAAPVHFDADIEIQSETPSRFSFFRPRNAITIDVDQDGAQDLRIFRYVQSFGTFSRLTLFAQAANGRRISGSRLSTGLFEEGDAIDQLSRWTNAIRLVDVFFRPSICFGGNCSDPRVLQLSSLWGGSVTDDFTGYLGVRETFDRFGRRTNSIFNAASVEHGWVALNIDRLGRGAVTAHGFETLRNTASIVGARTPTIAPVPLPASAFLLGAAVIGLGAWRRRKA